jgi:predicted protein tyrosine phosphatase
MQAINICAGEAADISQLPDSTVLISINEEYGERYPLQFEENVLRVSFSDVCSEISYQGQVRRPIGPKQIGEILDFIQMNLGKHFLVHCAAGVSRSSAVCLFLHLIHGYTLRADFWRISEPNSVVLRELIVTHKRREVGIYRS